MSSEQQPGPLVIIGGAEDREGDCLVLREFVRAAGGVKANIAVMTAATEFPEEVGETYSNAFQRLGAETVNLVHTDRRDDAEAEHNLRYAEEATGIFFTGETSLGLWSSLKAPASIASSTVATGQVW